MLVAKNSEGIMQPAWEAVRGEGFYCPVCDKEAILKRGPIKIAHFAHLVDTDKFCDNRETEQHMEAKYNTYQEIKKLGLRVEVEKVIGKRRADIYFEIGSNKVVIEFQNSFISSDEASQRTLDYSGLGIAVIWVSLMDIDYIINRKFEPDEFRINIKTQEKYFSAIGFNTLFVYTKKGFVSLKLGPSWGYREATEYYDELEYIHKTKKMVIDLQIYNVISLCHSFVPVDKLVDGVLLWVPKKLPQRTMHDVGVEE